MQELHQHPIYKLLATKYTKVDLDYVLLLVKAEIQGLERFLRTSLWQSLSDIGLHCL